MVKRGLMFGKNLTVLLRELLLNEKKFEQFDNMKNVY